MTVHMCQELLSQGVTEQDVLNVHKALGKRLYLDELHITKESFDALLREAYQQELDKGRLVTLWSKWID